MKAFPVLCRILISLNLLGTTVGVIVLSAGIGNDVVGWILLALCVTLINSGANLTALWILLVCIGYCIFVAFPVRWAFLWLLRRTGSLVDGPTQSVVAITVMLVLASAFFTQIIGVHAIFGAFLIGLICPHGIFAIKLQEKIEDLISVLLLPLYFALSGLNTNLGLLNSAVVWGYVIGVCAIALIGKIIGGTIAARLNGLLWRESLAIGCLMSCKGLVELIVLNIGFQAHILSQRTFTIFVVMALITTFTTTPLVVWTYPPWYRNKLQLWREGKIDWNGNSTALHSDEESRDKDAHVLSGGGVAQKVLVYLRLDSLSSLFTMAGLLTRKEHGDLGLEATVPSDTAKEKAKVGTASHNHMETTAFPTCEPCPLQIRGLRLMELTERASSVMKVAEVEEFTSRDPVIRAFSTFGHSQDTGIAIDGQVSVVPDHIFSDEIVGRAQEFGSDFIFLPWSETGTISEHTQPFDNISLDPLANTQFTNLAEEVFRKAQNLCNVGVLLNWNVLSPPHISGALDRTNPLAQASAPTGPQEDLILAPGSSGSRHYRLVVPFLGSKDDLCAIRLGLQLAENDVVETEVLDLRSHGGVPPLNSDDQVKADYETTRAGLPSRLTKRIQFVQDPEALSALDAIVTATFQPNSRDTIVLLGRNWTSSGSSGDLPSTESNFKGDSAALGALATSLVRTVVEQQSPTALLVVQAPREAEGEDVRASRKSASAHFAEALTEAGRRLSWAR